MRINNLSVGLIASLVIAASASSHAHHNHRNQRRSQVKSPPVYPVQAQGNPPQMQAAPIQVSGNSYGNVPQPVSRNGEVPAADKGDDKVPTSGSAQDKTPTPEGGNDKSPEPNSDNGKVPETESGKVLENMSQSLAKSEESVSSSGLPEVQSDSVQPSGAASANLVLSSGIASSDSIQASSVASSDSHVSSSGPSGPTPLSVEVSPTASVTDHPVSVPATFSSSNHSAVFSSPTASESLTTITILSTKLITVTDCGPAVSNCPAKVISTVIPVTTVCPVSEASKLLSVAQPAPTMAPPADSSVAVEHVELKPSTEVVFYTLGMGPSAKEMTTVITNVHTITHTKFVVAAAKSSDSPPPSPASEPMTVRTTSTSTRFVTVHPVPSKAPSGSPDAPAEDPAKNDAEVSPKDSTPVADKPKEAVPVDQGPAPNCPPAVTVTAPPVTVTAPPVTVVVTEKETVVEVATSCHVALPIQSVAKPHYPSGPSSSSIIGTGGVSDFHPSPTGSPAMRHPYGAVPAL